MRNTWRPSLVAVALSGLVSCGGGGGGSAGSSSLAPDEATSPVAAAQLSYLGTTGSLIDRYCVACHRDGGVAPFGLETHEQVYGKVSALVYVLESDTMPPVGHADLLESERGALLDWLNDGAPLGDSSQAQAQPISAFTYHGDTRAIIERECVGCHTTGGIAPFPLEDYQSVYGVRAAATFALENDSMPPWPPTRGYTPYTHDRSLSAEEKYILLDWLRGGAAQGDPASYQPPPGEPDPPAVEFNLRLNWAEAYTPILKPDDHRCFAIEWPEQEFTYVTHVDVIPDQQAEVHHVIVSVAEPEDVAAYMLANGQDGSPGWYCLGAGGVPGAPLPRQIGGWVPGAGREPAPRNTGVGIEPGSLVIVQMHYNTLATEPTADRSTVLIATRDQVERPARGFLLTDPRWLASGGMPIEAGDPEARHEMIFPAFVLARIFGDHAGVGPADPWVIHQGFLHMHNLGKTGRTTLIRQDGSEQVILDIRDWDFNWQGTYNFQRELLVQPQDRIKLECSWDNSQENQQIIEGMQLETQYVEWGDGTQDEMCLMSIYMTRPESGYDYSYGPSLHVESPSYRQPFQAGDLVPLRLILNNFSLHDPGEHDHAAAHDGGDHPEFADDHAQVYGGHYHVYLDTQDDSAPHLTAWDDVYYYQLPDDLAAGLHTLRVSLRAEDHHPIGLEQTVQFEVVDGELTDAGSLIDVDAWAMQDTDSDSFADHRPATVECPDNSWYNEDGALEVETGYCNYLSLSQPAKTGLHSGDTVHLVLWHGELRFDAPAEAHVAIRVAGKVVWEENVAIPAGAEIYDLKIPINFDAPAGSDIEYHLHNHGFNSWTLLKLELQR